jgi:G3E family GTPase
VPVTVVAGFLGSGKTTLVNRILAGGHGLKVAVLVNDFGSVSIDARLIVDRDATTITLDNGCVCCSISADLVSQLTGLLEGPSPPEHVLVETSGVSDPGRVLVAFRDPYLRRLAMLLEGVTPRRLSPRYQLGHAAAAPEAAAPGAAAAGQRTFFRRQAPGPCSSAAYCPTL